MKKIIIGIVVVVIIGLVLAFAGGSGKQEVSILDAVDTAGDFYSNWLEAVKAPESADPDLGTLIQTPHLSKSLRDKIKNEQKDGEGLDPVLCQTTPPENFSMRRVLVNENEAQLVFTSKDKSVSNQALFMLKSLEGGWYIEDIECSLGEVPPEQGEFSFEQEGFLLKDSIPAPYNSENWHIVFEQDGVPGHVVPLLFDSESQCMNSDENQSICDPSSFTEATEVFVRGQMTEYGAEVKQLELVK